MTIMTIMKIVTRIKYNGYKDDNDSMDNKRAIKSPQLLLASRRPFSLASLHCALQSARHIPAPIYVDTVT
jgi:hypothetical protein